MLVRFIFLVLNSEQKQAIQLHDQKKTIPTFAMFQSIWRRLMTSQWDSVVVGIMSAENLSEGL